MNEREQQKAFSGPLNLQGDFPAPTLAQWRTLAEKSLGGATVDSLEVEIDDGVGVRPLYTSTDQSPPSGLPGHAPFTRGTSTVHDHTNGWLRCQLYDHPDAETVAGQLAAEIGPDPAAAWITLAQTLRGRSGRGEEQQPDDSGVVIWDSSDLARLCTVCAGKTVPVFLDGGGAGVALAALFVAAARASNLDTTTARGSFAIDPLACLTSEGELRPGFERYFALMADVGAWCLGEAPGIRAAAVSTLGYHMAGAGPVQEMAFALATGVEYLRAFERAGIEPEQSCRQILFRFAVGRDLFTEVARMRAFRRVWAHIASSCGVNTEAAAASIHAVTSSRTVTARDPWVNMLRSTVGAFAAAVGGADFITILPFDSAIGQAGDLGRRMAMNSHRVLREESHLGRVLDPAGGSWFIETLTDELAHAAWRQFRSIESNGGMCESITDGSVSSAIAETARKNQQAIAHRTAPITGVSTWPNLGERDVTPPAIDVATPIDRATKRNSGLPHDHPAIQDLAAVSLPSGDGPPIGTVFEVAVAAAASGATLNQLSQILTAGGTPCTVTPLPRSRDAQRFEDLRDASDRRLDRSGRRPQVFLANLGSAAEYTARSTFAKNLLEAGGIETVPSRGLDSIDATAGAFADSGCAAVCVCSSDERYQAVLDDLVPALRNRGAAVVLLAGKPGVGGGIDVHCYSGCDVLGVLDAVLSSMEAAS